jgi:hypothetical protein
VADGSSAPRAFTGNPYDGHTLAEQMKQVDKLDRRQVGEVHVDMGYRGHDYDGAARCMSTSGEEAERHERCGDG